ncbi:MAG: glyoxalase [Latescibacteria bacterium DG_63]|nr:MAG: glyoxalase [Latescibacteria bacterium DG_63]
MVCFDAQITFCYTRDLAETARFYEKTLELELALDQGGCRIYRVAGDAFIGFCTRKKAARPEGVILTLVTADVDGWYHRLMERGVAFEKSPEYNPDYDIYHCFLRDPSGYLIEIQRFENPAWRS